MKPLESTISDIDAALVDLSARATFVQLSSGAQFRLEVHKLAREFEWVVATIDREYGRAHCMRFIHQALEILSRLGRVLLEAGGRQFERQEDFQVLRERLAGLSSPDGYLELVRQALHMKPNARDGILSIALVQAAMLNKAIAGETSGADFVNQASRRHSGEVVSP